MKSKDYIEYRRSLLGSGKYSRIDTIVPSELKKDIMDIKNDLVSKWKDNNMKVYNRRTKQMEETKVKTLFRKQLEDNQKQENEMIVDDQIVEKTIKSSKVEPPIVEKTIVVTPKVETPDIYNMHEPTRSDSIDYINKYHRLLNEEKRKKIDELSEKRKQEWEESRKNHKPLNQ